MKCIPIVLGTLVSLVFFSSACGVNQAKHQRVLRELTKTQLKLEETQSARAKLTLEHKRLRADKEKLAATLEAKEQEEASAQARAAKLATAMQATEAELLDLRRQREASEKRLLAFRALTEKFRSLVDTGKLKVTFRQGQMVLELPSGVLFRSGKSRLSSKGKAALQEILDVLASFKERRFLIAGHTDNRPLKGRASNWALSTARAVSVVLYMTKKAGFAPQQLAAAGYGEFSPIADNSTEQGRTRNRRIEIILVPDLSELPGMVK